MRGLILILSVFFLSSKEGAMGQGQKTPSYKIVVNIYGMRSDSGKLYLSLYNSEEGYPKKASVAYRLAFSAIEGGKCKIELDGIPAGTYAVACYHDENNNGRLDSNFFGKPTEGTGASNDAKGSLGPPKFKDAKFRVDRDTTISIKINY
jgi:uncharacterized protein (DUF2141 family)